jgi:hypothetical protein
MGLYMVSLTLIHVLLIKKNSDQAREVACVRSAVHEKRHGGRGVAWAYGVGGMAWELEMPPAGLECAT